jgi:GNAT superfamily N-acetyltransferase
VLTVTPLDVTDEASLRDAHAVITDVIAHDSPDEPRDDFATFAAHIAVGWEGEERVRYLAHLDGEPAGFAAVVLYTGANWNLAQILRVMTRPALRRRGVGRALIVALLDHARREGRAALVGGAEVGVPGGSSRLVGGDRFALAMGGVEAARRTSSRLDLTDSALPARLSTALDTARAHSVGYSVILWQDRAPDECVADLAALYSRILTDQPTGTIDWKPEEYDVDRFRAMERNLIDHGLRNYCAAARHDATGETVGYTEIAVSGASAWQGTTIVAPAHRGHRLGLLIKAANALQARDAEPQTRHVTTANNDENEYMLAINRAIGFRPHTIGIDYRIDLASG